jgi:hypothetical protein
MAVMGVVRDQRAVSEWMKKRDSFFHPNEARRLLKTKDEGSGYPTMFSILKELAVFCVEVYENERDIGYGELPCTCGTSILAPVSELVCSASADRWALPFSIQK